MQLCIKQTPIDHYLRILLFYQLLSLFTEEYLLINICANVTGWL